MNLPDERPQVQSRWHGQRRLWPVMGAVAMVLAAVGVAYQTPSASAASVDTAGSHVLVNHNSGKAMDLYGWTMAKNAPVHQWPRSDLAVQQWQFVNACDGFYRVRWRYSDKVLELPNGADGTPLPKWKQARAQDAAGGR